eukprot:Phypoly_transcript_07672.p1 GENE.Phypoly_transcript_07672~~Phypoly_transcript_07672.p1  ORF type:complete len:374 (+),score=105.84 Phypoly_transcript_07672:393-1514(+)
MDDCVAGLSFSDEQQAANFLSSVKHYSTSVGSRKVETPTHAAPATKPPRPLGRPPEKAPSSQGLPSVPIQKPLHPPGSAPPPPSAAPPPPVSAPPPTSAPHPPPHVETPPSHLPPPQATTETEKSVPPSHPPTNSNHPPAKKENSKRSFLKRFMSSVSSVMNEVPEDFVVSDPHSFRHESHIGWDTESGFEIRNIPPEWRKLFQQAGVKKSELKDANTVKYMMEVISDTMAGGETPAPPPPITATTASGSLPPPPIEHAVKGAPPPPPPPPPPGPPPPPSNKPPTQPQPPQPGPGAKGMSKVPSSSGRDDLMKSIQQGKELKHVTPGALPDLKNLTTTQSNNLVSTLSSAMSQRRAVMQDDDEEEEDNEEWSD